MIFNGMLQKPGSIYYLLRNVYSLTFLTFNVRFYCMLSEVYTVLQASVFSLKERI